MGVRALVVGINNYSEHPLKGCVNDATAVHDVVRQRYGAPESGVRLLLDSQATRAAIEDGLRWLSEVDPGEFEPVRLFFYAGHGTQRADEGGDEPDGADECIMPHDYQAAGMIADDDLQAHYSRFPPSAHVLAISDCCHSGTIDRSDVRARFVQASDEERRRIAQAKQRYADRLDDELVELLRDLSTPPSDDDLRRMARSLRTLVERRAVASRRAGSVIQISAARDEQLAADATFGDVHAGALTFFLLEVLREARGRLTYAQLIAGIRPRMLAGLFEQVPQLTCAEALLDELFLRGPTPAPDANDGLVGHSLVRASDSG